MLSSTSHDLAQQMFVSGHRAHLMLFVNINKRKVTRFLKTFEPGKFLFSVGGFPHAGFSNVGPGCHSVGSSKL